LGVFGDRISMFDDAFPVFGDAFGIVEYRKSVFGDSFSISEYRGSVLESGGWWGGAAFATAAATGVGFFQVGVQALGWADACIGGQGEVVVVGEVGIHAVRTDDDEGVIHRGVDLGDFGADAQEAGACGTVFVVFGEVDGGRHGVGVLVHVVVALLVKGGALVTELEVALAFILSEGFCEGGDLGAEELCGGEDVCLGLGRDDDGGVVLLHGGIGLEVAGHITVPGKLWPHVPAEWLPIGKGHVEAERQRHGHKFRQKSAQGSSMKMGEF
jgi:hypothetical protein